MASEVLNTQNFCPIKLTEALRPDAPTKAIKYLKGKSTRFLYWYKTYNNAELEPTFISNAMPYKTAKLKTLFPDRSFFFQVQNLLIK